MNKPASKRTATPQRRSAATEWIDAEIKRLREPAWHFLSATDRTTLLRAYLDAHPIAEAIDCRVCPHGPDDPPDETVCSKCEIRMALTRRATEPQSLADPAPSPEPTCETCRHRNIDDSGGLWCAKRWVSMGKGRCPCGGKDWCRGQGYDYAPGATQLWRLDGWPRKKEQ